MELLLPFIKTVAHLSPRGWLSLAVESFMLLRFHTLTHVWMDLDMPDDVIPLLLANSFFYFAVTFLIKL